MHELGRLPRHIAIIMDGNGRWAKKRGLPRVAGHRAGVEALRGVVRACGELGIDVLSLYAFSTENWKRPREEVDALMNLLVEYLRREVEELCRSNVRVRVMGQLGELPPAARREVLSAMDRTKDNTGLVVNLALNYGGRREIVEAARALAVKAREGNLDPADIDERVFAAHLYTAGLPDPDLLIRPGGEVRVSNFLLWQVAYTELWVTPVFWPDFSRAHLEEAIAAYQGRRRRFGGLDDNG